MCARWKRFLRPAARASLQPVGDEMLWGLPVLFAESLRDGVGKVLGQGWVAQGDQAIAHLKRLGGVPGPAADGQIGALARR